jgi:hypothetical protein
MQHPPDLGTPEIMASQPWVSGAHYFRNILQPSGNIESAKYFQHLVWIKSELAFESIDYIDYT